MPQLTWHTSSWLPADLDPCPVCAGIAVSLLRLATKATLPDSPEGLRRSANLYFCISALACLGCVLLYSLVLPRLGSVQRRREAAVAAATLSYGPLADAPPVEGGDAEAAEWTVRKAQRAAAAAAGDGQQQQQQQGGPHVGVPTEHGSSPTHQQLLHQGQAAPLLAGERHSVALVQRSSTVGLLQRIRRLAAANALVFV